MDLKLEPRKPSWWENRWKPKKPILYILEYHRGEWINTYWWGGNWNYGRKIKFCSSAEVNIDISLKLLKSDRVLFVVGRSGTTLRVKDNPLGDQKIKSLPPGISEWTCFGTLNHFGSFSPEVIAFNLEDEMKKSLD